jgi:hypothetical protein
MEPKHDGSSNRNEDFRTGMKNTKIWHSLADLLAKCDPEVFCAFHLCSLWKISYG